MGGDSAQGADSAASLGFSTPSEHSERATELGWKRLSVACMHVCVCVWGGWSDMHAEAVRFSGFRLWSHTAWVQILCSFLAHLPEPLLPCLHNRDKTACPHRAVVSIKREGCRKYSECWTNVNRGQLSPLLLLVLTLSFLPLLLLLMLLLA